MTVPLPALATGPLCILWSQPASCRRHWVKGRVSTHSTHLAPPLSLPWVCFRLAKEPSQRGIALDLCIQPALGHPHWRLLGRVLGLDHSSMAFRLDSPRPNTSWDMCQSEHLLSILSSTGTLRLLTHCPHFSVGRTESRRGCDGPKTAA